MNISEFIPAGDDEILFDVDEVLSKNNIIHVARELGLNTNRSTLECLRIDKHKVKSNFPTMTLNHLKNTYKCWVCKDVEGDVIDLVMEVKKICRKKAIEFLAVRGGIESVKDNTPKYRRNFLPDKEDIYSEVVRGINNNKGIDLLAFISLKGGTGKSLIVNNLAFSFALLSKFISDFQKKDMQMIELIDLDFGKPDQRLIIGIEPKYYIEDIMYDKDKQLEWNMIKEKTYLDGINFVSSSPVRRSQNLFFFHKNEIIYLINNSEAKIKLADFGGGVSKDILDFLHNIHSKIFVITPEDTSKQAIFNLMLTMVYDKLKNVFQKDKNVMVYIEKLRDCIRTGYRVDDLRFELERLDENRIGNGSVKKFYENEILPLRAELGLPPNIFGDVTLNEIKIELAELEEKLNSLMFSDNNGSSIDYNKKLYIYKKISKLVENSIGLDSYVNRLHSILRSGKFGLIVNRTNAKHAWEIKTEVSEKIKRFLDVDIIYLGNLRESKSLTNISNYKMPYIIYNPEDDVLQDLYHIGDNILGLKRGSLSNVVCKQKEYIREIKSNWSSKQVMAQS
ncbi:CHC2 zinc finger domain-containing protein [candidate division KSB1 bacterium]